MSQDLLGQGLARYLSEEQLRILGNVRVGIAGSGGIGSNVALMLARSGVRHFLLIDFDTVEPSNLNRQQFFPRDVGRPKAEALRDTLLELSPTADVRALVMRISAQTLPDLLPRADMWVEAFDGVEEKRLLVEACLMQGIPAVSASGIAGWGGPAMRRRDIGRVTVIGDFASDISDFPPLAPRVIQASAMMTDALLEKLLGPCRKAGS